MKIILSDHAKKRMKERNISFSQVQEAVDFSEYSVRKEGKVEIYKKISNKTLKVIYEEKDNYIKIITLMWK